MRRGGGRGHGPVNWPLGKRSAIFGAKLRDVGVVVSNIFDLDYQRFIHERGRGRCLPREIVDARTVAAALMRDLYPQAGCVLIAKSLGMSDHTSALHYLWRAVKTNARKSPEYLEAKSILVVESPALSPESTASAAAKLVTAPAE